MVGPNLQAYKPKPRPMMCGQCGWHGNDQELMFATFFPGPSYQEPNKTPLCPKCGNQHGLQYLDEIKPREPEELFGLKPIPKPEGWGQW